MRSVVKYFLNTEVTVKSDNRTLQIIGNDEYISKVVICTRYL